MVVETVCGCFCGVWFLFGELCVMVCVVVCVRFVWFMNGVLCSFV